MVGMWLEMDQSEDSITCPTHRSPSCLAAGRRWSGPRWWPSVHPGEWVTFSNKCKIIVGTEKIFTLELLGSTLTRGAEADILAQTCGLLNISGVSRSGSTDTGLAW